MTTNANSDTFVLSRMQQLHSWASLNAFRNTLYSMNNKQATKCSSKMFRKMLSITEGNANLVFVELLTQLSVFASLSLM